jgi:rod shape-determining protein MreC
MYWIIQFIIQHKNASSLFVTVLLSLLMLSADLSKQQQIARILSLSIFYPFQFTIHQITNINNIFHENKKLKEEITTLSVKCSLLEETAVENGRLRTLLGFDSKISYTLLPAHAVVREPSYLYRSLVINIGQNKGVSLYMPVINKSGVIGKVIQVMPSICLVQLIRDPSERVSVMTKRNNDVGIFETADSRNFFIKYRKYIDISKGDTVVTSGLGGIYPKGLNVGIVKEIKDIYDPLFKDVIITPAVNFEHIEEVFVVKLAPKWETFRVELDSLELDL